MQQSCIDADSFYCFADQQNENLHQQIQSRCFPKSSFDLGSKQAQSASTEEQMTQGKIFPPPPERLLAMSLSFRTQTLFQVKAGIKTSQLRFGGLEKYFSFESGGKDAMLRF